MLVLGFYSTHFTCVCTLVSFGVIGCETECAFFCYKSVVPNSSVIGIGTPLIRSDSKNCLI